MRTLEVVGSLGPTTSIQLQRAVFAPVSRSPRQARSRATRSLRQLFDAGLLNRIAVLAPSAASGQLSRQVVHALSGAGGRALGLDPKLIRGRSPKPGTVLDHQFWLSELGVLALEGCPPPLELTRCWNDRVLAARKRKGQLSLSVIPDALLVIHHPTTGKDFPCLVELDLGTESLRSRPGTRRDIFTKLTAYLSYEPAVFRQEFGVAGKPIVLLVFDSQARLASVRTLIHELGGGGRFWLATMSQLRQASGRAAPLGANAFWGQVWQTPRDSSIRSLTQRCDPPTAQ